MPVLIGAKPERFEPAAGTGNGRGVLDVLLLERGAALGVGQHPGRRRRQRRRRVEDRGRIGEADRRPDHPAMRLDLVGDEGVAKIRARLEPSEFVLGIVEEDGKEDLAFVGGDQRPIVGDEFGEQRSDEQDQKDPERPCAALVAAEIVEAAPVHRREPGTAFEARALFRLLRSGRLHAVMAGLDPAIRDRKASRSVMRTPSPRLAIDQRSRVDGRASPAMTDLPALKSKLTPLAFRNRCEDRSRCR